VGKNWNPATQSLLEAIPNLSIVDDRSVNVSSEKVSGLDLSLKTKHDILHGTLTFNVDGTYTLRHTVQDTADTAAIVVINRIGLPAAFRFRASTGWSEGPVSANAFLNYVGSYVNQYTLPATHMGAWTTEDFTFVLDGSKLSFRKLDGWRTIFSVQNVFNRTPPAFYLSKLRHQIRPRQFQRRGSSSRRQSNQAVVTRAQMTA